MPEKEPKGIGPERVTLWNTRCFRIVGRLRVLRTLWRLDPWAHRHFSYRKEVIQPQVPLRLPCYDFVPITTPALGSCPLAVGADTSGGSGFHDVTGGVYKARERIHGSVADLPLLAIPASWSRVADSNLNWAWLWGLAPPRGFASFCTKHCSTCAAQDVRAILT
jgi:hypothetical protein